MKTICVMQPYLFPYVPYFQLASAVDEFWVFDDVQYIRRGWMNRNYILVKGEKHRFTLPVAAGSRSDLICEKLLPANFLKNLRAFSDLVRYAYREAPHGGDVCAILDELLGLTKTSFLDFAITTMSLCFRHLDIGARLHLTSELKLKKELVGAARVMEICQRVEADRYVNPIGGASLYDSDAFAARGIDLRFLKGRCLPYPQFGRTQFEPELSILDLLANVDPHSRKVQMQNYSLAAPFDVRIFDAGEPSRSVDRK
jgi:hypothetical protein